MERGLERRRNRSDRGRAGAGAAGRPETRRRPSGRWYSPGTWMQGFERLLENAEAEDVVDIDAIPLPLQNGQGAPLSASGIAHFQHGAADSSADRRLMQAEQSVWAGSDGAALQAAQMPG